MTREEASREIDNTACCFSDKRFRDAMHMGAAALRGPQPDPDTGLVPCGCGGSAAYHISYDGKAWSTTVKVACNKCLINVAFSALYELRGEEALADDAKNAWNTAMGWKGGAEELGGRK